MKSTRAAIYQAVFAKAQTCAGIATFSRIFRTPDELDDGQYPALFQEDKPEEKIYKDQKGLEPIYHLSCDLTIYVALAQADVAIGAETVIPSDVLSNIIDALEAAFAPPASGQQTLGGLVTHAEIGGRIERVSGIPSKGLQISMAVVPVIITTY